MNECKPLVSGTVNLFSTDGVPDLVSSDAFTLEIGLCLSPLN